MKHFRSGGVAKAMSKTLKNGVFEARRRRIFFENRDFYEFAPLVFGDLETRGGRFKGIPLISRIDVSLFDHA